MSLQNKWPGAPSAGPFVLPFTYNYQLTPAPLPRRPPHMPPAKHVDMHMAHRLPAFGPGIQHQPIPSHQLLPPSHFIRSSHQLAEQLRMLRPSLRHRAEMLLRDHQRMRRRLRVDVRERDTDLVLVQPLDRNRSRNKLAEEAFTTHTPLLNESLLESATSRSTSASLPEPTGYRPSQTLHGSRSTDG